MKLKCTKCKHKKDEKLFDVQKKNKFRNGRAYACKECVSEYAGEYYKKHRTENLIKQKENSKKDIAELSDKYIKGGLIPLPSEYGVSRTAIPAWLITLKRNYLLLERAFLVQKKIDKRETTYLPRKRPSISSGVKEINDYIAGCIKDAPGLDEPVLKERLQLVRQIVNHKKELAFKKLKNG